VFFAAWDARWFGDAAPTCVSAVTAARRLSPATAARTSRPERFARLSEISNLV